MADKFLTDTTELTPLAQNDLWLHVVDQSDVSAGNAAGTSKKLEYATMLASSTEINTGTDAFKIITPAVLSNSIRVPTAMDFIIQSTLSDIVLYTIAGGGGTIQFEWVTADSQLRIVNNSTKILIQVSFENIFKDDLSPNQRYTFGTSATAETTVAAGGATLYFTPDGTADDRVKLELIGEMSFIDLNFQETDNNRHRIRIYMKRLSSNVLSFEYLYYGST